MFKIAKNPTFTHVVSVMLPKDGGFSEEKLKATFNYLSVETVAVFDLKTSDGTKDFLRAVINKLDDLIDDEGNALTYNDDLRDRIIVMPNVRQALCQAYFDAVTKSKTGN